LEIVFEAFAPFCKQVVITIKPTIEETT